jgi:S-adenosylmethionine:tRNA ribosyltransferase-isomerase
MAPAAGPRQTRRLLLIDPEASSFRDASLEEGLETALRPGDLLVLNDAATIPASFVGHHAGEPVEVRLLRRLDEARWQAVLLGAGDWRTPTEKRPAPPAVGPGAVLVLDRGGFGAIVDGVSALSPRLVDLHFDRAGDALWKAIYAFGRPVQYAYQRRALALWDVQTRYGSRPWAVEAPSAGLPLTWSMLARLASRGVDVATLTHAAGLSSTGDPAIDDALPLAERYEIPAETVRAVARATRVIAVGTSVVRALEGSTKTHGRLVAGGGETELRLGPGATPVLVDGLLTGIHEPTASHFRLLQTFCPLPLLDRAYAAATEAGYLCHEFGDSNLILPS